MFRGTSNVISYTSAEKQVRTASVSQRDVMVGSVVRDHTTLALFRKALFCFSVWFFGF